MSLHDVLVHLDTHFVVLVRTDQRLQLRALFENCPLSPDTLTLVRGHKKELLEYLRWTEEADSILLSSARCLGRAWPQGFELETVEWARLEDELQQAYRRQDRDGFRWIIREREDYALEFFRSYMREGAK
jgi:hypothetical protein